MDPTGTPGSTLPKSETLIPDIRAATAAAFREKLGRAYWAVFAGAGLWSIAAILWIGVRRPGLYVAVLPWVFMGVWYAYFVRNIRARFWKAFAQHHGWTYASQDGVRDERGVMFQQGHSRSTSNTVSGNLGGRPLRIFEYQFAVGYGKGQRNYHYTVFEVRCAGTFPHLYLDRLRNGYGGGVGVSLPLPREFEEKFRLYCPQEYEIEALQLFTPDILAYLLDAKFPYDVEFVDQELIVFTREYVSGLKDLQEEFTIVQGLVERLAPKLDAFRFLPIGDRPAQLG